MNSDIKDSLFARNAIDCEKKQLSFSTMGLKYALTCSIILPGRSYKNLQVGLQDFQARKFFCIAIEFIYVPVLPCEVIGQDFLGFFDPHLVPVRDDVHNSFFYVIDFESVLVFADYAYAKAVPPVREIMQRKSLRFWLRRKFCLWRNRDIDGIGTEGRQTIVNGSAQKAHYPLGCKCLNEIEIVHLAGKVRVFVIRFIEPKKFAPFDHFRYLVIRKAMLLEFVTRKDKFLVG